MGRARRSTRAAFAAIVLGAPLVVAACSDDPVPSWDEWSADHVETLDVDRVTAAAVGEGIEVIGHVAGVERLPSAVAEVCGYANDTDERVVFDIRVGNRGRLSGGCAEQLRTAWTGWFATLAAIDGVDGLALIGGVANVQVDDDGAVVGVVDNVLEAIADDPPPLLFVDSERVSVRWTPDEGDLADELDLLDRLIDATGDQLDKVSLSDRRVNATIDGDEESLEQLRVQLGADTDALQLATTKDAPSD